MPYLHFETQRQREEMSTAIKKYRPVKGATTTDEIATGACDDEILIQAYLDHAMTLHPRRTLDQSLYQGFNTEERDNDQVVYRYCKDHDWPLKVFMTDQLWLWIFGRGKKRHPS